MSSKIKKINTIGIILRPDSPHLKPIFLDIYDRLKRAGIGCMLECNSAKMMRVSSLETPATSATTLAYDKSIQNVDIGDISYMCSHVDMLFSIGGDGTLLSVARASYGSELPILGINSGRLGYLTIASPCDIDSVILRLQSEDYRIKEHLMLEGEIEEASFAKQDSNLKAEDELQILRHKDSKIIESDVNLDSKSQHTESSYNKESTLHTTPSILAIQEESLHAPLIINKSHPQCTKNLINKINPHTQTPNYNSNNWQNTHFFALNEFLLSRTDVGSMLELEVFIDGDLFNHYRLDGLLVATPTGSSAYNISAGGALVYPCCRNVLLTPVCPHSLTQRPIILNDEFDMQFRFCTDGILISDGQQKAGIKSGEIVHIKVAKYGAMLVELESNSYFIRLRDKFNWGQVE